jgi:hypothetical protein
MLISQLQDRKIPKQFQDGRPVEHVTLVCDVMVSLDLLLKQMRIVKSLL